MLRLERSPSQRVFDFLEHSLFLGGLGIMSGLVGIYFFTPALLVSGVFIVLAFHRSGVVKGKSVLHVQIPAYAALIIFLTISLYSLYGLMRRDQLDSSKINIFLAHAHVFNYLEAIDSPKEEERHRIIDPLTPISLVTNRPYSFAFGVDNANIGIPFKNVRLTLKYVGHIPLEITTTSENEPIEGRKWQVYIPNRHYFLDFGSINDRWRHSWHYLWITFPIPGRYRFELTAVGDGVSGEIKKDLEVQAFDPRK